MNPSEFLQVSPLLTDRTRLAILATPDLRKASRLMVGDRRPTEALKTLLKK